MNRVYNNEGIIMACIVHLLREREMDIAMAYILSTLLIDGHLGALVQKSMDFDQLSEAIKGHNSLSRKLCSFGPYFINAIIILKQSHIISIIDSRLRLVDNSFPEGGLHSRRLSRIIKNADRVLELCGNLSATTIYNKLNIQI